MSLAEQIGIGVTGFASSLSSSVGMIAVIVIAVISVAIVGFIVLLMIKLSKSRDTSNSILVSKQF